MKKILSFILIAIILSSQTNTVLGEEYKEKTIIITLDQLDFELSENLINDNLSMGLLNIRNNGNNLESLFMTIATGRKVKLPGQSFKGLSKDEKTGAVVKEYQEIKTTLDRSYNNFSKQISFLGEELDKNNIRTSYMGSDNKNEALMISDKNGKIDQWQQETPYDIEDLKEISQNMLKSSDLLLISFDLDDNQKKIEVLSKYIEDMSKYNLIVFPKTVSGDVNYRLNDSIVPIFYGESDNQQTGILTSKSTKRQGVVSSLDIFPTITDKLEIQVPSNIGNTITVIEDRDLVQTNKNILLEFLNLSLIKYIFHASVTIIALYMVFINLLENKNFEKAKILINTIIISIPISMVLGIFGIHKYIALYIAVILMTSLILAVYFQKKDIKITNKLAVSTNILILTFTFFKPETLYESYIGYNSIVAGGRFYGFNNEIMGVLIATSIMTYYFINRKFQNKLKADILSILYFGLVIIALTGNYGANFGGFLSSIALFLILIYLSLFNRNINKNSVLSLIAIGALILGSNLYLDIKSETGSHAGNLMERINILGFYEFINMIKIKIKQLVKMTITPPWSIGLLAQSYFIASKFKSMQSKLKLIDIKYIVMFTASFIVLIINDTGVVAFVYMNTYLISNLLEE